MKKKKQLDSSIFENKMRQIFSKKFNVDFHCAGVKIKGLKKKFDLISNDGNYIGDAKYYKNIKTPAAKFSTIAEYVWMLEKVKAKHKFLVFGRDKEIPARWLKKYGSLTDITFYYYDKKLRTFNKANGYKLENVK